MPAAGHFSPRVSYFSTNPPQVVAIAERWNVSNAGTLLEQLARELKPDEIEKAKAMATAYTFKTK